MSVLDYKVYNKNTIKTSRLTLLSYFAMLNCKSNIIEKTNGKKV